MEILLPATLCIANIDETIKVCSQIREHDSVVLDAQHLRYASPLGMAMLKSALHSEHECRCNDIVWLATDKASYLQRMDFFADLQCPSVELSNYGRRDQSARLFELRQVTNDLDAEDVASSLAETMSKSIEAEAKYALTHQHEEFDLELICHPLKYLVSELLLNATTHAKRNGRNRSTAWVSAQKDLN
ncbi:MAG: hypothetical protein ACN6NT_01470, partial [Comamonas sp.]